MRKTDLIRKVRGLINPDNRPESRVFREVLYNDDKSKSIYEHEGRKLTKQECLDLPAKKHLFIIHRVIETDYATKNDFSGTGAADIKPYQG